MTTIHRHEWLWVLAWSGIILLLTGLPYLYGAALSGSAGQFSGFVIGLEDGNSYLAKMQEGRSGSWLFHLAYTPEPHPGELFFIYYLLLGKLAGLTRLPNVLVLHLSKLITIPVSLLLFYYFVAYFTDRLQVRRIALLMLGLTGGLGWLWLVLGGPAQLGAMPVDLWVPDASFFLAALTYPHLPLGQGLLLLFSLTSLDFIQTGQKRAGLSAAGSGLLVSLIHPYTLPIIGTVLGGYVLWRAYTRQQSLWLSAFRLLLTTLPSLPYLLYVLVVFNRNPAFIAWREQSLTFSPAPVHYLLGFGFTLGLALLGLWLTWRQTDYKDQFLRIWTLSVPFLLYLPLALQRRFLDGYQAPLAVLAAIGITWLMERMGRRRGSILLVPLLLLMSLTNVFLVGGTMATLSQRAEPVFLARTELDAAAWLARLSGPVVVLAAYPTGNYLPTVANVRVFVGHGPETANSEEKREQVKTFFSHTTPDPWRQALLKKFNIRYVYYGPHEKAMGDFAPDQVSYLQERYRNEQVQIFEVKY